MTRLTEAQIAALHDVASGLSRGEHAGACAALERRGMIRGDWDTGYEIMPAGLTMLTIIEDRERAEHLMSATTGIGAP